MQTIHGQLHIVISRCINYKHSFLADLTSSNAEVDETVIDEVKHEDVPSQPFITEQNVRDEHARKNWTRLKTKVKTRNVLLRMNTSMGFVPDDNRDEDRFHKMVSILLVNYNWQIIKSKRS